jgi:hypothetical protein
MLAALTKTIVCGSAIDERARLPSEALPDSHHR